MKRLLTVILSIAMLMTSMVIPQTAMAETGPIADGTYYIATKLDTNYVLDVINGSSETGTTVQLWTNEGVDAQKFKLEYQSNGYYLIKPVCSGLYLRGSSAGNSVSQSASNGVDLFYWKITATSGGYYLIQNKYTTKGILYMDVENADADYGTRVQMFERNDAYSAQEWKFIPVSGGTTAPSAGGTTTPSTGETTAAKQVFFVDYATNGGTGYMGRTTVEWGVNTPLAKNAFTRFGYVFSGWRATRESDGKWIASDSKWYTASEISSKGLSYYVYKDGTTVAYTSPVNEDKVIMQAQWTPYFTIKYLPNGGTGTMTDTKVVYGTATPLRANSFKKDGYVFNGWIVQRKSDSKYIAADDKWYTASEISSKGLSYKIYEGSWTVAKTTSTPGEVLNFYAQWKKNAIPKNISEAKTKIDGTLKDYTYYAPQIYRISSSSATGKGGGLCNVSAITSLLNRRLAFDGTYSSSNKATVESVMKTMVTNLEGPYNKTIDNLLRRRYVYDGSTDLAHSAKKTYKFGNVTYGLGYDSTVDDQGIKMGSATANKKLKELLDKHPEGLYVYLSYSNKKQVKQKDGTYKTVITNGKHAILITYYEYDSNGKIVFYAIDPVEVMKKTNTTTKSTKYTSTWTYKHGNNGANVIRKVRFITVK